MELKDKVAIVTGAASGIGKGIAMSLAHEGAKLAIADLRLEAAEKAVSEIRGAAGVAIGVSDETAVNGGAAAVVETFGGVDRKEMLAINLNGAFLKTKACLPHMYGAGRGGSIIYMGSVHSKEASLLKSAYVTAKHGLI